MFPSTWDMDSCIWNKCDKHGEGNLTNGLSAILPLCVEKLPEKQFLSQMGW